ncbi:MAG: MFS transporter [Lachnospiraceae bacterium]|nr:MFS transporter [Lachnospiraceae bacterium]
MKFFEDKIQNRQFILSYAVFMLNGMLALSIGSLLPFIRDSRGLDYAFCGLIVSLHSVGNLVSSFTAGALPMLLGRKKSILIFECFFPLSYLIILFSKSNLLIAFAFFATGLARGAASNYCNLKINGIATGKAWALNGLHAMFAIGAFLFPIINMLITKDNGERWVYACGLMLIIGCITWILYMLVPETDDAPIKKKADSSKGMVFGFFKEPIFYLCITTLFFYLCAEQGVIGWMITYFKDTELLDPNVSQITASVLWVMILCGRLTTAYLSTRHKKENLLPAMGIGIVIFFIVLILSRSTVPIMIGIMGFGFSMAGIYATTVSFAGELIKKYSLAWSFILTTASFGSIIMPSIIGYIAEHIGIAVGMSSIALVLVVDMICIMSLVLYVKKNSDAAKQ